MAIDPSISLGIRTPEPIDITRFQQLRNLAVQEQAARQQIAASQASEAISRAQLPGVEAQSEIQARAAQFNRDILGNPKEYTNPDGSINIDQFANYALGKGYLREGQAIYATQMQNIRDKIANARSEQDRQVALSEYYNRQSPAAAMILHSTPENQRSGMLQTIQNYYNNLVPGSGDTVAKLFGERDEKTGMVNVNPDRVKAVREATINAATQEQMTLERAQRLFTDASRDPNSPKSVAFRNFVQQQSGGSIKLPANVSEFDGITNPLYREASQLYISGQLAPGAARMQAAGTAVQLQSTMSNYDSAIKAIENVPSQLLPTRLGTIGSDAFKRYVSQNPSLAGLETAIQVHNNEFPNDPIDPMRQSLGEIRAKLKAGKTQLESRAAGQVAQSQMTTLPTTPGAVVPEKTQRDRDMEALGIVEKELAAAIGAGKKKEAEATLKDLNNKRKALGLPPATMNMAPAAKTEKTIVMVDRSGNEYDIPESKEPAARRQGLIRK